MHCNTHVILKQHRSGTLRRHYPEVAGSNPTPATMKGKGTALYQQEIARTISEREQWRLSTAQLEYEISRAENRIIKRLQNNPIKLTDLSIPEGRSRNDNNNELDN